MGINVLTNFFKANEDFFTHDLLKELTYGFPYDLLLATNIRRIKSQ